MDLLIQQQNQKVRRASHCATSTNRTINGQNSLTAAALMNQTGKQKKENIKSKVGYEWKSIYKALSRLDQSRSGSVSKNAFQQACQQAGVNLSRDEIKRISQLFPASQLNNGIDFLRMSTDL